MSRFGSDSMTNIDLAIDKSVPYNTVKTHTSIWKQFTEFCKAKKYELLETTSLEQLNLILKDWAWNMKKENGENYKELVVKTMWNTVAKKMQEMYFLRWKIIFDPFKDIMFKSSRDARNAKRRNLQMCADKRKSSSASLKLEEYYAMILLWDEDTPAGLQRKFFHIASVELAWRGGEAVNCRTHYFKEELDNSGIKTGRVEYNPLFNKTAQGGEKKMADSKWLVPNTKKPTFCPVRLFKILMVKRSSKITTDRLFLTVNPSWKKDQSSGWYKNTPVGKNELSKWTKEAAEKAGLNTKEIKITNHSMRSTAVSNLAKGGVGEQQLIKITGHNSANSIKPYLQMDNEHYSNIINTLRSDTSEPPAKKQKTEDLAATPRASHSTVGPINNIIDSATPNVINELTKISNSTPTLYQNCNLYFNCTINN